MSSLQFKLRSFAPNDSSLLAKPPKIYSNHFLIYVPGGRQNYYLRSKFDLDSLW